MGLAEITQGKGWKSFMAKLYGWGAAIVIVGALFKIQHYPGAGPMLVVGLSVEAIIFFFSAFEPVHEEIDWSLVYPELAGMPGEEKEKRGTPTEELDKMLEEAKIGPELLKSVGTGLKALSENTSKLADISDASVATGEYVKNMKGATQSAGVLANSYAQASNVMNELAASSADVKNYNSQMQVASKSLTELNSVYATQLKDSNENLKNTSKFYQGINELLTNLSGSADDTRKYKEEVSKLTKTLTQINTVYEGASTEDMKNFNEQVGVISKNLTALNAVYELQLQDSNTHLKTTTKFYEGINEMMGNLSNSVNDTKQYKEEVAHLAKNLAALNTVYGNMLSAMNINKA